MGTSIIFRRNRTPGINRVMAFYFSRIDRQNLLTLIRFPLDSPQNLVLVVLRLYMVRVFDEKEYDRPLTQ